MAVRGVWQAVLVTALVFGGIGSTAAAPPEAVAPDYCGASAAEPRPVAAPVEHGPSARQLEPVGAAGTTAKVAYSQPAQLPIGLWSAASVTLRAPARHGSVRLALVSAGFSTDSVEVQRWVPARHRWEDLAGAGSSDPFPTHGSLRFTLATRATAAHPETVALRIQDLDRPGTLAVTASYADGLGHSYRAPAVSSPVTAPRAVLTGWPQRVMLTRGGPSRVFTLTLANTTDRAYPAVSTLYYAYGMAGGHALTPRDLVLEQYQDGTGWTRLPLAASSCDPGMTAAPRPAAGLRLVPGAGETVRLRLAVAATAPRAVTSAEAGLSVQSGDTSLASWNLPFTVG